MATEIIRVNTKGPSVWLVAKEDWGLPLVFATLEDAQQYLGDADGYRIVERAVEALLPEGRLAADELTRLAQELGTYDEDFTNPPARREFGFNPALAAVKAGRMVQRRAWEASGRVVGRGCEGAAFVSFDDLIAEDWVVLD